MKQGQKPPLTMATPNNTAQEDKTAAATLILRLLGSSPFQALACSCFVAPRVYSLSTLDLQLALSLQGRSKYSAAAL